MEEDYVNTNIKLYDQDHAHFNESGHVFVGLNIADFIIKNHFLE